MRKLLLLPLLTLAGLNLHAQGTISGHIVTPEKESVPFAAISVLQRDVAVTGTASDREGRFAITNLPHGVYKLTVALAGFNPHEREFVIGNLNKALDFGHITLQRSTVMMGTMTVAGQRLTVADTLDKKSFSAAEMIASAAGSALDAMKQLPGVTIDQESKVQLRGSDKVAILIDGKQSALTGFGNQKGLENIPATHIEFIEIINNPSAKYDAAGMAGIVNIVLKPQQKSGLHGEVGFSLGLGQLTRRRADLPTGMPSYARNPKYSPSLNLNYKTAKLNLFLQSS
ncbi:MAG: TonB-dependent receptor, partial [Verrucomicrobia bacterium]|nr:TonB-dependent receptor [Verrucomicrobiota bacterium]